jgi:hypothetical protein
MDSNIPNFNSSASAMTHAATPRQNKPLDRIYDVFLSHRRENEALVTELNDYIENELHFEAYVDWKDSSSDHLDREHVTAGTANYLRTIMRHSCSLIFVVGEKRGRVPVDAMGTWFFRWATECAADRRVPAGWDRAPCWTAIFGPLWA